MNNVTMLHGAGGKYMLQFIHRYVLKYFGDLSRNIDVPLYLLEDSAIVNGIAFTTDSYTVYPLFFPGGDIGRMAVCGTINDLAVKGATKILGVSCGLIIEEGFEISNIEKILNSMREAALEAETSIITGDTKVVEKGRVDKLLINCSGIGVPGQELMQNYEIIKRSRDDHSSMWLITKNIRAGDKIILNGPLGDHAVAILAARGELGFKSDVKSDVAPLNKLMREALKVGGVTCAKDPTRGGLAGLLNEWAENTGLGFVIREDALPISSAAKAASELLGIDILEVGNEGKVVMSVINDKAEEILESIKNSGWSQASIIGYVTDSFKGVILETTIGGKRIIPPPIGDPVPRIC
ncbi:MAG: hydrogenase expression/formation protein HypE [Nitrososphaerota archaeon]